MNGLSYVPSTIRVHNDCGQMLGGSRNRSMLLASGNGLSIDSRRCIPSPAGDGDCGFAEVIWAVARRRATGRWINLLTEADTQMHDGL